MSIISDIMNPSEQLNTNKRGSNTNAATIMNPGINMGLFKSDIEGYADGGVIKNYPNNGAGGGIRGMYAKGGGVRRLRRLKGYTDGGEVRRQAKDFWKTAPQQPVPVQGQGNPANPAAMMKARLMTIQKPAPVSVQQVAPTASPIVAKVAGQNISARDIGRSADFASNVLPDSNGAMGMGLQGASQVLDQPIIKNQINAGVVGLKTKAGIDPNATPFNYVDGGPIVGPGTGKSDSIHVTLPVKGFVVPADAVKTIGLDKLQKMADSAESENPREEKAEGGQEEVPAKVSNGEFVFTPEEVKALGGTKMLDKMVADATDMENPKESMMKNEEIEPKGYAGGGGIQPDPNDLFANARKQQMLTNSNAQMKALSESAKNYPGTSPSEIPLKMNNPTKPGRGLGVRNLINNSPDYGIQDTIAENTGVNRGAGYRPMSAEAAALAESPAPIINEPVIKSVAQTQPTNQWNAPSSSRSSLAAGVKNLVTDPVNVGFSADAANQTLLENSAKNGLGISDIPRMILSGASRVPKMLAETIAPGSSARIDKFMNTPVDFGNGQSANPNLPNVVKPRTQAQDSANYVPAVTGITPGNGGMTIAELAQTKQSPVQPVAAPIKYWNQDIGLRADNAPQSLDWNETRFSNSGDPVQDAAIEARRGIRGLMDKQIQNSSPESSSSYETSQAGKHSSSSSRGASGVGGFKPEIPGATQAQQESNTISPLEAEKLKLERERFEADKNKRSTTVRTDPETGEPIVEQTGYGETALQMADRANSQTKERREQIALFQSILDDPNTSPELKKHVQTKLGYLQARQ